MVLKLFCGLQSLINGNHKFKHCFETRFWNAQKGAIQKHGFENLINATAISNTVYVTDALHKRDKLGSMRCAMAQYERARHTLRRKLL